MIGLESPKTPEDEREWKKHSLGNNLFQYAFVRSLAEKLKVKFFFPEWKGDEIFDLKDSEKKTRKDPRLRKRYIEPNNDKNVPKDITAISDGTEVRGYFQSEIFFNKEKVRKWFKFKKSAIKKVRRKYKDIDFPNSVGLHLRFGDTKALAPYYVPDRRYYEEGIKRVHYKKSVLVFSDEISLAKEYLREIKSDFIYIEGNSAYEDLYLMSKCHDFICSASTLCWWGAWLNDRKDKTIIAPKEGSLRPTYKKVRRNYFFPREWIKLPALRKGMRDNYYFVYLTYLPKTLPDKIVRGFRLLIGLRNKRPGDRYIKED